MPSKRISANPRRLSDSPKVADILHQACRTADWDLVQALYRQCSHIADDQGGRYMPDDLVGFLSEAMSRLASAYIGEEEELARHTIAVFGDAERRKAFNKSLFRSLYHDERFDRFAPYQEDSSISGRRRPCPSEAVVETCRRLRDANAIRTVLRGAGTAGILGGSASYGRFYNVHGNRTGESSDLDIVVVLNDFTQLRDVAERLELLSGLSKESLDQFRERSRIFVNEGLNDRQTIFSQKLTMWAHAVDDPLMVWANLQATYLLSLHFMSLPVIDWLLVADATKLSRDETGSTRLVGDYREQSAKRQDHQRSFSGRNQRFDLEVDGVDGGFLRRSRVYLIDRNDQYYPGMFQNLILPRFERRWDDLDIEGRLATFKWKMIERLRYERRIRPHEFLRLSLSHTRNEVFAPHVRNSIDTGIMLA
jgi:hypothetical protein